MKTDIEIARESELRKIEEIAAKLSLTREDLVLYGDHKAKVKASSINKLREERDPASSHLILVSAITPTKAGEGKTTISIGLADALASLGKKTAISLREPSMGPVFGIKGGATGGGYAQVLPMDEINLHFTGDMHALTAANNLIAACIDNHIYWGNELRIDPARVLFHRCLDMNDRALRSVELARDYKKGRCRREEIINITVASEIMAVFCLARDLEDLEQRVSEILIAYDQDGKLLRVRDLGISGAVTILLKDAFQPNLVQTIEGTPAFVHGGPFANIAHGCSSRVATETALRLADYVVTEAGFASDLGAEKFFDIKCRAAGLRPELVVLVVTIRALKLHGGQAYEELSVEDPEALCRGLENLDRHVESVQKFGLPYLIAINAFGSDHPSERAALEEALRAREYPYASCGSFAEGSAGSRDFAEQVVARIENSAAEYHPLYDLDLPVREKLERIAREIYGADGVDLTEEAEEDLREIEAAGYDKLAVCVAKTQNSLSDDPEKLGRPRHFRITVREIRISAGAGFLVCLTGKVMTMPGLPKKPKAEEMYLRDGEIVGLS